MFKKLIIKVGSLLMDPVKKVGNTKFSEKFVNFSNKNPWIKVLLSFFYYSSNHLCGLLHERDNIILTV